MENECAQSLEVDLRGKTFEEVVKTLKPGGFVSRVSDATDMWRKYEEFWHGKSSGSPVQMIWINQANAHLLTVTIFNGKTLVLDNDHDLHLFDCAGGEAKWSAIRTIRIMQ